jgi:hypothetical protein
MVCSVFLRTRWMRRAHHLLHTDASVDVLPAVLQPQQCEDLEDTPSLHHMFRLMRSIIMLNDTQVCD